jgi:hypothetical protein
MIPQPRYGYNLVTILPVLPRAWIPAVHLQRILRPESNTVKTTMAAGDSRNQEYRTTLPKIQQYDFGHNTVNGLYLNSNTRDV